VRLHCGVAGTAVVTTVAERTGVPALQILDHYFGNVCELDLVFGFHKVYCLLDEFIIGGEIQETSKKVTMRGGSGRPGVVCPQGHCLDRPRALLPIPALPGHP
jgi:Clathrin adaptor complex small chain